MTSVVQPWVSELSLRMQAVVLSALRGCDGKPKEDASKKLTRHFRGSILIPADPATNGHGTFMRDDSVNKEYVSNWCKDLDHYPVHWLMHFAHACAIVGYFHPGNTDSEFWSYVYFKICDAIHVHPEISQDIMYRLRDKQD